MKLLSAVEPKVKTPSSLFLAPQVQVLELRLPSVAAELQLKERIGFLKLVPFVFAAQKVGQDAPRKGHGFVSAAQDARRKLAAARERIRRSLLRLLASHRAERITILHHEQQPTGQSLVRMSRVYLN